MSLSNEQKDGLKEAFAPLIGGVVASAAVIAAATAISKLLVTNVEEKTVTGDKELKPTDSETTVHKSEVSGAETEGKVAKEGVDGTNGKLEANETEGIAATEEATASKTGAKALKTEAGAMQVKTKGMEIQ